MYAVFWGVIFELSPPTGGGNWTQSVLYNFCSNVNSSHECLDGETPLGQLIFDVTGNLYGTTEYGGTGHGNGGTVFELSPGANGWTQQILYSFCSQGSGYFCPDGNNPLAGVVFDATGDLLGTTLTGGGKLDGAFGTVFELSPVNGAWKESVLFTFSAPKVGEFPTAPISVAGGDAYSTFSAEGKNGFGGVFRLNGQHKTFKSLSFNALNGAVAPTAGVLLDFKNNLIYGTTSGGMITAGNVFEISGAGVLTNLHTFCSQAECADGENP